MTTDTQWQEATTEALLDADTYADWLMHHCFQRTVSDEAVRKCGGALSIGRTVFQFDVATIQYVMMTDTDPAVVVAARDALRERFASEHSERVMDTVWRQQDAAKEAQSC